MTNTIADRVETAVSSIEYAADVSEQFIDPEQLTNIYTEKGEFKSLAQLSKDVTESIVTVARFTPTVFVPEQTYTEERIYFLNESIAYVPAETPYTASSTIETDISNGKLTILQGLNEANIGDDPEQLVTNEKLTEATDRTAALELRADAKDAEVSGIDVRTGTLETEMDTVEGRVDTLESEMDAVEARADTIENDVDAVEARSTVLESEMDNAEGRIYSLEENQQSGVMVFQTKALLDAYTPTLPEETGSFKVANDPTSANNGYYSWNGTIFVKDTITLANTVDANNTSDSVSGSAVFNHTLKNLNERSLLTGFNIDDLNYIDKGVIDDVNDFYNAGSIYAITLDLSDDVSSDFILDKITVHLQAGAGTGEIQLFGYNSDTELWKCIDIIPVSYSVGGVEEFSISNGKIPSKVYPAGTLVTYKYNFGQRIFTQKGNGKVWRGFLDGATVIGDELPIVVGSVIEYSPPAMEISYITYTDGDIGTRSNSNSASISYLDQVMGTLNPREGVITSSSGVEVSTISHLINDYVVAIPDILPECDLESVVVTLSKIGDFSILVLEPEATSSAHFTVVEEFPVYSSSVGVNTFIVNGDVITKSISIPEGGLIAVRVSDTSTAQVSFQTNIGDVKPWIQIIGYDGVDSVVTRETRTDFDIGVKCTYLTDGLITDVNTLSSRVLILEDELSNQTVINNNLLYALGMSGVRTSETKAYIIGDSTITSTNGATAMIDLIGTVRTHADISTGGDTFAGQRSKWMALDVDPEYVGYVVIQLGLNDLDPNNGTSTEAIARLQLLVDTVRNDIGNYRPIFLSTMLPCRQRFFDLAETEEIALEWYAAWGAVNESIMGLGSNPITGVDYRISAHTPLMADENGDLKSEYDTGDKIHPNNLGKSVMVQAWTDVMNDVAGVHFVI